MKRFLIIAFLCLTLASLTQADTMHELNFNAGVTLPQGTFNKYTDNGIYGHIRYITHWETFKAFSGFGDFSGALFSFSEDGVYLTDGSYVDKSVSEYSVALHIGALVGSDSRNSFFRPKIGIAGGLYLFNTQTRLIDDSFYDDYFYDKEILAEDNQVQIRLGYRGIIGTDLFFSPRWGLSFEFTYDHIFNLHQELAFDPSLGAIKVGQTARFHTFSIGVIFPLTSE